MGWDASAITWSQTADGLGDNLRQRKENPKMMTRYIPPLLAALSILVPGVASGQAYPQKPVTVVVGAAAGGSGDTAIRVIADRMSMALGQQIIVENVAGAGGMTATGRVARAEPDGYTLLI